MNNLRSFLSFVIASCPFTLFAAFIVFMMLRPVITGTMFSREIQAELDRGKMVLVEGIPMPPPILFQGEHFQVPLKDGKGVQY